MKQLAAAWIGVVFLACAHGGSPDDAALVLPGDFSEATTLADLQARFGTENVGVVDDPDDDDPKVRIVLLFPDDPTRRATVRFWDDDGTLEHFSSITVTEPESRWRGNLGVRMGTTLAELRALNGAEFWYTGFSAEGRAVVRDWWNAGALDVAEGQMLYFGVDLALRGAPAAAPRGEDQISSEDPASVAIGEHAVVSALIAWSSLDDEW